MAGYQRIDRISETLKHGLVEVIRGLKDPRIASMTSVVSMSVTKDLRFAKVYVSFLEESKAKDAMKGLQSAGGWLRREVGNDLKLRYTPELVWALDDSITYGAKLLKLINSLEVSHDDETEQG